MKKVYVQFLVLVLICNLSRAQHYQRTPTGVKTGINSINVEVQFFTPSLVRVLKYPSDKALDKKSFAVIKTPDKVALQVVESGNIIFVNSEALHVRINFKSGQVNFFNPFELPRDRIRRRKHGPQ